MNKKTSTSNLRRNSSQNIKKKHIDYSPPSVFNFIYMCFMFVFKRFVFAPTHIKIGIYMVALLFCSVVKDFQFFPHTNYFSYKQNFFNKYFVKLGWAWTCAIIIPFIIMTSSIYTGLNVNAIKKHLSRVLISSLAWYVFTSLFEYIDSKTGNCSLKSVNSKLLCKTNKHEWINGFDISGHTFILMHSLFLMLEEVKIFNEWDLFHKKLLEKLHAYDLQNEQVSLKSENQYQRAEYLFKLLTPFIKLNFILMALLALLWEVMLLSTFLYFHTIMHKLVAAFTAIVFWFLTYKTWYPNKNNYFSPGLPGDNSI